MVRGHTGPTRVLESTLVPQASAGEKVCLDALHSCEDTAKMYQAP